MTNIKEQINHSLEIYEKRMRGETDEWSATTKCVECGALWLWGIEDNLNFTCDQCKAIEAYHNHDCHLSEDDGCGVCERYQEYVK